MAFPSLESDEFTIRPIEQTDATRIFHAVQANRERLALDFPSVASSYRSESESTRRTEANVAATLDTQNGLDVLVATDPNNQELFGVATHSMLGRRAMYGLGLRWKDEPGCTKAAAYIAGWTIPMHPTSLTVAALEYLIGNGTHKQLNHGTTDNDFLTVAFIRSDNWASQRVVRAAGMHRAHDLFGHLKSVSSLRLRVAAGIPLRETQQVWITRRFAPLNSD